MGGSMRPLDCCDGECAIVNGCQVGGYKCARCGEWKSTEVEAAKDWNRRNGGQSKAPQLLKSTTTAKGETK